MCMVDRFFPVTKLHMNSFSVYMYGVVNKGSNKHSLLSYTMLTPLRGHVQKDQEHASDAKFLVLNNC